MNNALAIEQPARAAPPATPRLRDEPKPKGSWKALIGRTKNDELSESAFTLGAEWREQMNCEGR